ncbi:MAG TPA: condensation domain-containing protein, partial [Thermoanaerobaculia bacterium]|nr:condensation domain-containing protein [Thermoanaerobaculia bacterium]
MTISTATGSTPPGRADVQAIYPLSPLQKGMLFHSLYAPGTAMYVQQLSCLLTGELDKTAFQAAWQQAIDRHPVLRTAFVWEGLEEPLQVVQRHLPLPITQLDWADVPDTEQEDRLGSYLETDRQRGFDLARAPLTRVALIRLGDGRHRFVWTTHHLVLDGWSGALLLREVLAAYESRRAGAAPTLPPSLPTVRPYRDYILWLKAHAGADPAPFWREVLRGFEAPTPLPGARPERGPAGVQKHLQGEEHDARELRLPAAETAALQAF